MLNTVSGRVFVEKVAELAEAKAHMKDSHAEVEERGMALGNVLPHFGCP